MWVDKIVEMINRELEPDDIWNDNLVFRLHYQATVVILVTQIETRRRKRVT